MQAISENLALSRKLLREIVDTCLKFVQTLLPNHIKTIFGASMTDILVLHGPNLNMLGVREPGIYGSKSLDDINNDLSEQAHQLSLSIDFFQSNVEGDLVSRIQQAYTDAVKYIIINPAAYTHTSVAMRDALLAVQIPFIEVHLSNVHQREAFRHHSYFSDKAIAVICGLGADGYSYALDAASKRISQAK